MRRNALPMFIGILFLGTWPETCPVQEVKKKKKEEKKKRRKNKGTRYKKMKI